MRPGEIQVRHATERDLAALLALLARYFAEGGVQHTEVESTLRPQMQVSHRGVDLGFWVAEQGEEVVGCVQCRALPNVNDAAECKRLYVQPDVRGRGVASRLLEAVEATARGAGFVWMCLDSKADFVAAMALYRRRGYTECERFNDNRQADFFFGKRIG